MISAHWHRSESVDLGLSGQGWTLVGPDSLDLSGTSTPLENVFGRGGIQRRGSIVLRPYRRGGWVRHLNEKTYFNERRFAAEAGVHQALWAAGLPTVEPLGFAFRPHRLGAKWGVEGLYLTGYVAGFPWPKVWDHTEALMPQFKAILKALSEWGLRAPDLNATNFHVGEDGVLRVLDWDRAAWTKGQEMIQSAHLDRMNQSLDRLGAPKEIRTLIQSLGAVTK